MNKRKTRFGYRIDSGGIIDLTSGEIKAILRAADELIAVGGRSLLTKILKGSKDQSVVKYNLDDCPVYGYYNYLTLNEIIKRVDWMIENGYLQIEYAGQMPVIVFSKMGWEIERETYAEELLRKLQSLLSSGDYSFVFELKDRDRQMILLLIEKIENTHNPHFIPLLKFWQEVDYKKVRIALHQAIDSLAGS
jgi:hypothetical protein